MRGRGEKEERKELYPLPHRLAESLRNKAQPGNDPGVDALFSKTEKKKKKHTRANRLSGYCSSCKEHALLHAAACWPVAVLCRLVFASRGLFLILTIYTKRVPTTPSEGRSPLPVPFLEETTKNPRNVRLHFHSLSLLVSVQRLHLFYILFFKCAASSIYYVLFAILHQSELSAAPAPSENKQSLVWSHLRDSIAI